MSTRYVFSFYEPLPDMDLVGERILVSLWRRQWLKAGLTPIVLGEWWASRHPIYREFIAAVSKLPSTNPPGYELACFTRWLAVQVAAKEYPPVHDRIILCDYDVVPYCDDVAGLLYRFPPTEPLHGNKVAPMQSLHGNCPALVIGTPEQFAEVCQAFMDYDPAGKTHCSDQYIFEEFIIRHPEKFKVSMDVKLFTDTGWETASAIHFSNSVMQNHLPKWKTIPTLRPL